MIVILGSGGHARAVVGTWDHGHPPYRYATDDDDVHADEQVIIGVGDLQTRKRLYERFRAQIFEDAAQIMRGVILDPGAKLGVNVLLNTGCQVDHDCIVGHHCVIGPGAILCGGVTLGAECAIGAGAIILQDVKLEARTKVPAGTLVVSADEWRHPVKR